MTSFPAPVLTRRTILTALAVITLLSLGLRWRMVTHTVVPSRDCLVFVRIAMQINDPPTSRFDPARQLSGPAEVLRETDQPPGYPLAILAMAKMHGLDLRSVSADQMVVSAQLVSLLAGVLLIFPMFAVASRVFGPFVALLACGWFQILPVCVEVTSDGLSDGLFLLTAITAIWFGQRALDCGTCKGGVVNGLLTGILVGVGYVVRPDSLIVGLAIGLLFAGACIHRWRCRLPARPLFLAGIALTVGTIALMSPYVATIGKLTNKPTGQGILEGGPDEKTYFDRNSERPGVRLPFAAWWDANADGKGNKMVWGTKALASEFLKGGHYLLPILALTGIVLVRKRWTEASVLLLILPLALHLCVLWFMAGRVGYVSQRHTLLSVMIASIFAAVALPVIAVGVANRFNRGSSAAWLVIGVLVVAASCLPRDFHRLHVDRAGHREAGEWIRDQGNLEYPVVDPFGWTEFYSGRTVKGWTTAHPYKPPFIYAVLEPNAKSHHSRLPWLEPAQKLAEGGEMVFQFPADVPMDRIKIAVYRCPPLKPGQ